MIKNICIITDDINSYNYKRCYDRCKEFKYDQIQYVKDYSEDRAGSISANNHLSPFRQSKDKTDKTFLRFYSHYTIWQAVVKQQEPYLIIEDDAYQITPIPGNINHFLIDIINFSAGEHDFENILLTLEPKQKYGDQYVHFEDNSLSNQKVYLISPNGAKKLINFTKEQGWLPVGIHINSILVDLKYYRRKFFI